MHRLLPENGRFRRVVQRRLLRALVERCYPARPTSRRSEGVLRDNSLRQYVSSELLRARKNSIADIRDLLWTVPRKHALLWA